MADTIKTISLKSDHENPLVVLCRDGAGVVTVRTEAPFTVMRVSHPDEVVVPMFGPMGALTQTREAQNLRNASSGPVDIYVVGMETKAGARSQGMVAVVKASKPIFEVR